MLHHLFSTCLTKTSKLQMKFNSIFYHGHFTNGKYKKSVQTRTYTKNILISFKYILCPKVKRWLYMINNYKMFDFSHHSGSFSILTVIQKSATVYTRWIFSHLIGIYVCYQKDWCKCRGLIMITYIQCRKIQMYSSKKTFSVTELK